MIKNLRRFPSIRTLFLTFWYFPAAGCELSEVGMKSMLLQSETVTDKHLRRRNFI